MTHPLVSQAFGKRSQQSSTCGNQRGTKEAPEGHLDFEVVTKVPLCCDMKQGNIPTGYKHNLVNDVYKEAFLQKKSKK